MDLIILMALGEDIDISFLNRKSEQRNLGIVYEQALNLGEHNGFYPLNNSGETSGFEIYRLDYNTLIKQLPAPPAGFHDSGEAYNFRFGSSNNEATSALYTAAILAESDRAFVNVLDPQSGRYLTASQLIEFGKQMVELDEKN